MSDEQHIASLQRALARQGSAATRDWWQNYLKGAIDFRGVGIPEIRRLLAGWRTAERLGAWPPARQFALALRLLEQPLAEDKLAGVLYLQLYLREQLPWREQLEAYARIYARELIFDWNTSDWFCIRVLGPLIAQHGGPCARALARWHRAEYLWQARSALVPFVKVIDETGYYPLIETLSAHLLAREERFAKTAVGWVLRDLSRHDPGRVSEFVQANLSAFSSEALRNAVKYLPAAQQRHWREQLRAVRG